MKLIDTLVPVALTSENAVSQEPQVWFSCSKTAATYLIKDVAGATSAAPTYFGPKFIEVQNQTQAQAPDCRVYDLVSTNGKCQFKSLDGGLFANSPTLLTSYLLTQDVLNKTFANCTSKYNNFYNGNYDKNLTLQFATLNPGAPPKISLGDNIDLTVVNFGTGYFIETDVPSSNTLNNINQYVLAASIISTIIAVVSVVGLATGLGAWSGRCPLSVDKHFKDASSVAAFGIAFVPSALIAGLGWASYSILKDAIKTDDGFIGFATNNILGGILSGNEAADIAISRDVFGSIFLNPIFNIAQLPLDASDSTSLNLMQSTAVNFFNQNIQAFTNLTNCLSNNVTRTSACDSASTYFYDFYREAATPGINGISIKTVDWEVHDL